MSWANRPAPPWRVSHWLNARVRSPVTALYFIQKECPACAAFALPQAVSVDRLFRPEEAGVVAIHPACDPPALAAYVEQHRLEFPVGMDEGEATQRAYGIEGTPTLVLIDGAGRIRRRTAGPLADLQLGAELMSLIRELS